MVLLCSSVTSSYPPLSVLVLKVEDKCSLDPAMDILSYSEREWKGNTAKSALIRKVGVACSLWEEVLQIKASCFCYSH